MREASHQPFPAIRLLEHETIELLKATLEEPPVCRMEELLHLTYLHEATPSDNRKPALTSHTIPPTLNTSQAQFLIQKLIAGQILNEHWQPIDLSNAEKGILAQYISCELNIKTPWQSFASLWGMKPETLRRAAARAMEQKKSLGFQDRLKGLLRA